MVSDRGKKGNYMNDVVFIDFETYWDTKYSLRRQNVITYVRDPRFQVLMFAYMVGKNGPIKVFSGTHDQCREELLSLDLPRKTVVAHNAMFEGAILEWIFHIQPSRYFCTMMAARPYVVPFTGSASLGSVAEYFQLDIEKNSEALEQIRGKRLEDLEGIDIANLTDYNHDDVSLLYQVWSRLAFLPQEEQDLLDLTIKKFTRPRLLLDTHALEKERDKIEDRHAKMSLVIGACGVKKSQVMSNNQFVDVLAGLGVNVPTKISPATGRVAPALAKSDVEFTKLLKHPDIRVRNLVEARLLFRSTIDKTRIARLIDMATAHPYLPVPLLYYGAHTGRFSGIMDINLQNLRRGGVIRNSIVAPEGYVILTVDLSAIEARITAALAGQADLLAKFAAGIDVYSDFATDIYGYEVTDCEATKTERFVGKMCILGLGFGMGYQKFRAVMEQAGIVLTDEEASTIVKLYRTKYQKIPALWKRMDKFIEDMMTLTKSYKTFSPTPDDPDVFSVHAGKIMLPNGMPIFYPDLHIEAQAEYRRAVYLTFTGHTPTEKALWGGAFTENVVQALARIIISRAEVLLARHGLTSVMQVHDELVFLVPTHTADRVAGVVERVVTAPVPWLPNIPLACKVGVGSSYGDAK